MPRTSFAGITNCQIKDFSCHPGLDPGSSFKIKRRIRLEELPLDSRFRGNDNLISFFFMLVFKTHNIAINYHRDHREHRDHRDSFLFIVSSLSSVSSVVILSFFARMLWTRFR